MAKCIFCGKSGLFLHVDSRGYCSNCLKKYPEEIKLKERQAAEHEQYLIYAENKAKADNLIMDARDYALPERIGVYERVIAEYSGKCDLHKHELFLSELYTKNGQYDQAWSLLNALSLRSIQKPDYAPNINNIRYSQYLVMEARKEYLRAVELLSCYYVLSSNYPVSYLKKMRPMAKKAGLSLDQITAIDELLQKYVNADNKDENAFIVDFRKII